MSKPETATPETLREEVERRMRAAIPEWERDFANPPKREP